MQVLLKMLTFTVLTLVRLIDLLKRQANGAPEWLNGFSRQTMCCEKASYWLQRPSFKSVIRPFTVCRPGLSPIFPVLSPLSALKKS